ncbi:small subunit of replication factor C [Ordospora colligata]|uniref:Small subunit of replication factor C n=1 Tax=Ordospora colligata OC4 TaxID=1354746 RepID=A0A0B2UJX9_9MICR|nr:small subunit of replication factor C [Ordospora colligata OC4]KHN69663.1 small subunit of replication factor C [Ordospora colligata OC4]TBU15782.1 small subunit of replication factor C [Ordospora colligata]TBU15910.1 small subunit of replication factor C [Ordospora colligata]TBU18804.1 small subunit of replication factor C [Ordospora colligata]
MIWIERYRPTRFEDMDGRKQIVNALKGYTIENMPHIIMHGQSGSGKKTALMCLISHLYGEAPEMRPRTIEVTSGSKKLEVAYTDSDGYMEICPAKYGHHDKAIIQGVIKEMGQTKPILSMFGGATKKTAIKLVAIMSAEQLSVEAQAALRRTIEMYSGCLRIVLVCEELSRLIEPIRSRCFFLRIPGFSNTEMVDVMNKVLEKENYSVPVQTLTEISEECVGNMRRALCVLELFCFNMADGDGKRVKTQDKCMKLEWELIISSITLIIKSKQTSDGFIEIRKLLYTLLNSCISSRTILLELFRQLSTGVDSKMLLLLCRSALMYEERMKKGTKGIYHLEGFVASSMCVFAGGA